MCLCPFQPVLLSVQFQIQPRISRLFGAPVSKVESRLRDTGVTAERPSHKPVIKPVTVPVRALFPT